MNVRASAQLPDVERESFFAAQARWRASAWRWSAALAIIVAAIVFVISVLLGPLLYALIGVVLDLVNLVLPAPDLLGRLGRLLNQIMESRTPASLPNIAGWAAIAALPGFLALTFAGWRLGRIFDARHADALRARLGLRDPRAGDFEEQQLRNLVDEIALAAGRAPPRLQMMDSTACNLGVVGDGEHATLIVTRGLLDRLDRAHTQALVGQGIAALGNGDGLLAVRILRLDAVIGLLSLLAQAPLSRGARAALAPLFGRGIEREFAVLQSVLGDPDAATLAADAPQGGWRDYVWMPLAGSLLVGILIVPIANLMFVAPLVALIWRRRRLLGDAMAVQFARDPQALAEAYAALASAPTRLELNMPWLASLFVLDTHARSAFRIASEYPSPAKRLARLNALGASVAVPPEQRLLPWQWLVLAPVGAVLAFLLSAVIGLGVYLCAALNGLFLLLPTALLHALLRKLGHG